MPSIKLKGQDAFLECFLLTPTSIRLSVTHMEYRSSKSPFLKGAFDVLVLLFYLSVFWYFQSFLLLTVRCFLFIHLFNFGINLLAAPSLV